MKIKSVLLCLGVLSLWALPCHAVFVGSNPGLEALSKQADVIAMVRVDSGFDRSSANGWERRDCFVYQTLKGDLKANQRIPILLNDLSCFGSRFSDESLAPMSSHLVFLRYSKEPANGANYLSIVCPGADLPLAPSNNETKPEGATLKAQIQTLVRRYRAYRDEQMKKVDESLDKTLEE